MAVNLDDATGQLLADVHEELLAAEALDVWTVPIGMKKGRPGVMLCALCRVGDERALAARMLGVTGSFGVRFRRWERLVLEREHVRVTTRLGSLRLKVGRLDGRVVSVQPEFEDVQALAAAGGVPVREALRAAQAAAEAWQAARAAPGPQAPRRSPRRPRAQP